jgi:hypothetical protein
MPIMPRLARQLERLEHTVAELGGGECRICHGWGFTLGILVQFPDGSLQPEHPGRQDIEGRCVGCGASCGRVIIIPQEDESTPDTGILRRRGKGGG